MDSAHTMREQPRLPPELADHLDAYARGDTVLTGWHPLLVRLHHGLIRVTPNFRYGQVKEKWGTLRCYLDFNDAATAEDVARCEQLVDEAEDESKTICEICGCPGRLRNDLSWWKVLCDRDYRPIA